MNQDTSEPAHTSEPRNAAVEWLLSRPGWLAWSPPLLVLVAYWTLKANEEIVVWALRNRIASEANAQEFSTTLRDVSELAIYISLAASIRVAGWLLANVSVRPPLSWILLPAVRFLWPYCRTVTRPILQGCKASMSFVQRAISALLRLIKWLGTLPHVVGRSLLLACKRVVGRVRARLIEFAKAWIRPLIMQFRRSFLSFLAAALRCLKVADQPFLWLTRTSMQAALAVAMTTGNVARFAKRTISSLVHSILIFARRSAEAIATLIKTCLAPATRLASSLYYCARSLVVMVAELARRLATAVQTLYRHSLEALRYVIKPLFEACRRGWRGLAFLLLSAKTLVNSGITGVLSLIARIFIPLFAAAAAAREVLATALRRVARPLATALNHVGHLAAVLLNNLATLVNRGLAGGVAGLRWMVHASRIDTAVQFVLHSSHSAFWWLCRLGLSACLGLVRLIETATEWTHWAYNATLSLGAAILRRLFILQAIRLVASLRTKVWRTLVLVAMVVTRTSAFVLSHGLQVLLLIDEALETVVNAAARIPGLMTRWRHQLWLSVLEAARFGAREIAKAAAYVATAYRETFGFVFARVTRTLHSDASPADTKDLRWSHALTTGATFMLIILSMFSLFAAIRPEPTVTVVHWTNGHLLRDGSGLRLLRQMQADFNAMNLRTASGKRIEVDVRYQGGAEQASELIERIVNRGKLDPELPDPMLVTPSASHWLVNLNAAAGYDVVDLKTTDERSLAKAYVGIVTYEAMATCLGWPEADIGYADIIALRNNPLGWSAYGDCAKAEWGSRPLLAFTDPSTSDTGRAVLLALNAIAAGVAPENLTSADVQSPESVQFVSDFQSLVDHYMIATRVLNSKIYQGPKLGHFFLMPEDNLIHLYQGTEEATINGFDVDAPPLGPDQRLVMIYPSEGAILRENCACLVRADWVSDEEIAASQMWVDYLREPAQQRAFMQAGFRPGTNLETDWPITSAFGLNPDVPERVLNVERIHPGVAAQIDDSWALVKRPAIVTFIADTSGSMFGPKLHQAKEGLERALEAMAPANQVGLVTFGDSAQVSVAPQPLSTGISELQTAIREMTADGETALYDALKIGLELTDSATGPADAIRAVVVLTDGAANRGVVRLDDLIQMSSIDERPIVRFRGFEGDRATDYSGRSMPRANVIGEGLNSRLEHEIQIFFIALGDEADLEIGRILSSASGAEFTGTTEADLAEVLEEFSRYF